MKPSLDKKQLNCLRSLDAARALRKELAAYVQKLKSCPACPDPVIDGKLNKEVYKDPYLVIASDALQMPNGELLHVLFKNQPSAEYHIWMGCGDEDPGCYVLKMVSRIDADRKTRKLMQRYLTPEYKKFWESIK